MQTNNKLREALEIVAKQLTDATEDENFGEDVMYLVGCMRTMSQKCRTALAEPVRNCDRFADETDAQIAFLREVWLIGVRNLDRDPFDGWTNEMKYAYSKWLFSPETDKEVENEQAK